MGDQTSKVVRTSIFGLLKLRQLFIRAILIQNAYNLSKFHNNLSFLFQLAKFRIILIKNNLYWSGTTSHLLPFEKVASF